MATLYNNLADQTNYTKRSHEYNLKKTTDNLMSKLNSVDTDKTRTIQDVEQSLNLHNPMDTLQDFEQFNVSLQNDDFKNAEKKYD